MRQERTVQASLFDLFAGHEIGRELKAMSAWLDDHRELAGLVAADLRHEGVKATGRQGLPAEAVLRCAVLKQYRQLSYQELAFHLEELGVVPRVREAAVRLEPAEVGAASDDQRDPRRNLGADQSDAAGQRPRDQARARPQGAARQHGHRGADPRAERQQPVVGRGAGDGAPAAGGAGVGRSGGAGVARSPSGGEEACARPPVHPRTPQTDAALPRADPGHAGHAGLPAAGGGPAGADRRSGDRAVARQGRALSAPDRAHHRAERAAGAGGPAGAGQRQAGEPVRAPRRHHPQGPRGRLWPQAQPDHPAPRVDRCWSAAPATAQRRRAAATAATPATGQAWRADRPTKAPAAAATVQPWSVARCTGRSRPCGVKRAFLCMFIRALSLSAPHVSQPPPDRTPLAEKSFYSIH